MPTGHLSDTKNKKASEESLKTEEKNQLPKDQEEKSDKIKRSEDMGFFKRIHL